MFCLLYLKKNNVDGNKFIKVSCWFNINKTSVSRHYKIKIIMKKKEIRNFDCFHPVSSKITYFVVAGLFVLFPIAAFRPGFFALVANDSVISLFEDYHHVIRNLFFIFLLLHLLEVRSWYFHTYYFKYILQSYNSRFNN